MPHLLAHTAASGRGVCLGLMLLTACESDSGLPPGPDGLGAGPGADAGSDASALDGSLPLEGGPTLDAGDGSTDAGALGDGGGGEQDAAGGGTTGDGSALDAALEDAASDAGPNGSGPGDWTAGDYPPDSLMTDTFLEIADLPGQNGHTRGYKVHVPPGYDPDTPTPLVFCIHGLGQTATLFCVNGAQWPDKSDEEGFILVMPNGYSNSWNAGTCCGAASSEALDEVSLYRAILDEVSGHLNVDLDRVYATGLSNGGFMSYRLACEAADIFAAVAPGAGAIGINDIGGGTNPMSDFETCEPSRPVPVLHAHGTADALVPYGLQAPTLELLQEAYGCDATTVPAAQPLSGGDTACSTYTGCPEGVELTECTVEGGGHCWFGSPGCGTGAGDLGMLIVGSDSDTLKFTDEAWKFLSRFHR